MKAEKSPIVAIVGRPNVGKSTLFNRLVGQRVAIESGIPGTTRDRLYNQVDWNGRYFTLVDTAGLFDIKKTTSQELLDLVKDNVYEAISEADLILFVVDYNDGITDLDKLVSQLLRRSKKKVVLVVNKADNLNRIQSVSDFSRLGSWPNIGVSAVQKKNLGDLLDLIIDQLKNDFTLSYQESDASILKLAIVGRPNVGKSTLFNQFGSRKMIVSETPGTTRDSQSVKLTLKNQEITLFDTAGMIRSGKSGRGIEKFSLIRTLQAVAVSDIAVILMDANEGVTNLDKKIAGFAADGGKGLLLVFNKIDQLADLENSKIKLLQLAKTEFDFLPYAPLIFISAKDRENIKVILSQAIKIYNERSKSIKQEELDELCDLLNENFGQLPAVKKIEQIATRPPKFKIRLLKKSRWHFSFSRFVENRLRDNFDFTGTPIIIDVDLKIIGNNSTRK